MYHAPKHCVEMTEQLRSIAPRGGATNDVETLDVILESVDGQEPTADDLVE